MKDRPFLFSAPMICAHRSGTKTQTRRLIPEPLRDGYYEGPVFCDEQPSTGQFPKHFVFSATAVGRGAVRTENFWTRVEEGDLVWVRESWKPHSSFDHMKPRDMPVSNVFYLADPGYSPSGSRGRPGIHMPRWASRMTLKITNVRVERLNDCSEEDALAEGVVWSEKWGGYIVPGVSHPNKDFPVLSRPTAREMYAALWDVINGSGAWLKNPWIVAYTYEVIHSNIDAYLKEISASRTESVRQK